MTAPAKASAPSAPAWGLTACAALLLEGKAAWEFLRMASAAGAALPPLFLLHAAACALMAASLRALRRDGGDSPAFAAFVFVFSLSLPGLGMLGVLLGVLPALRAPGPEGRPAYCILRRSRGGGAGTGTGQALRYGPGGFRARLLARGIPAERRLGLLLTLRRRSTPHGNRLLREMLRDPADELRLAAYAVLERREKESQAAIAEAEAAARGARDGARRAAALRRLAFLHWEAAYQELADGEVSRHHLEQALRAAEDARAFAPDEDLAFLKGRILVRLGSRDGSRAAADAEAAEVPASTAAEAAFGAGAGPGVSGGRLIPHLAELAFRRGDFAATRRHLAALDRNAASGPLRGVLRFWLGGGA